MASKNNKDFKENLDSILDDLEMHIANLREKSIEIGELATNKLKDTIEDLEPQIDKTKTGIRNLTEKIEVYVEKHKK